MGHIPFETILKHWSTWILTKMDYIISIREDKPWMSRSFQPNLPGDQIMSISFIMFLLIILGLSFSIHPIIGFLALAMIAWICYTSYRAEERRIQGAMQAYANMAAKERRDARNGVINIRWGSFSLLPLTGTRPLVVSNVLQRSVTKVKQRTCCKEENLDYTYIHGRVSYSFKPKD